MSYRTDRVILVHQNKPGAATRLSHIGTMNGIRLDAYAFDLAQLDIDADEEAFAKTTFEAIPAAPAA